MAVDLAESVARYARAKSRQDVDAALGCCAEDFLLHTEAFRTTARGKADARRQLRYFFRAFPDYAVELDRTVSNGFGLACSGELTMTMHGRFANWRPTGRTARLPFFCLFTGRDGLLASEHFHFSDIGLCSQLGLPLASFRRFMGLAAKMPSRALSLI